MNSPAHVLHLPQGKMLSMPNREVRSIILSMCYECEDGMKDALNTGGLYEWLDENILSVEYLMIDVDYSRVLGCVLNYALGGPTVRINTLDGTITGAWGMDDCTIHFDNKLADAITEYYA